VLVHCGPLGGEASGGAGDGSIRGGENIRVTNNEKYI